MMEYSPNTYKGIGAEVFTDTEKHDVGRHTTLSNIYNYCDVDPYYKFTVVRNPYTRFISTWVYFTRYMDTAKRANLKSPSQLMDWIENKNTKQHVLPQAHWHDKRFNHVYKFEDLKLLNLSKWIPRWNNKKGKIAPTQHTIKLKDNLKQRIFNFYRDDFELFGYSR